MSAKDSSLLPYIMDLLSNQNDLKLERVNICENIKDSVISDHLEPFNGNVESAVQYAIELGINLGILSLSRNIVRIPFNYREPKKSNNTTALKNGNGSGTEIVVPKTNNANNTSRPRGGRPATYRPTARYQIQGLKQKTLKKKRLPKKKIDKKKKRR